MSTQDWRAPQIAAWGNSSVWPEDPPGFEFLPRALQRFGRGLYGDQWRGDELGVDATLPNPGFPNALRPQHDFERVQNLHAFLTVHRPDLELRPMPPFLAWQQVGKVIPYRAAGSEPPPTAKSYLQVKGGAAAAPVREVDQAPAIEHRTRFYSVEPVHVMLAEEIFRGLCTEHAARCEPLIARREHVWRAFRKQVISEFFETSFMSNVDGGQFVFKGSFWNLPSWRSYLTLLKADWERPAATGLEPKRASYLSWLFVKKAGMDEAIEILERARREGQAPAEVVRPVWWPTGAEMQSLKGWLIRPEVQAEAMRRIGSGRTKKAYCAALEAMVMESDREKKTSAEDIGRMIRQDAQSWAQKKQGPCPWPDGLAE